MVHIKNTTDQIKCPKCNSIVSAEFVDVGVGTDMKVSPYYCLKCGWVEKGCLQDKCITTSCQSWGICQGKSKQQIKRTENHKVYCDNCGFGTKFTQDEYNGLNNHYLGGKQCPTCEQQLEEKPMIKEVD